MRTIGRYRVLGEIARGGMGVVLRAFDPQLEREVALKLLLGAASAEAKQRQRFQIEARALGRLGHPNVVAVHAAGEHQGCPYLVMDLIEGESLGDRIHASGALDPQSAARLTLRLAAALQHVHDNAILHRDVKPDNVILPRANPDEPMLTDFGLSKDLDASLTGLSKTGRFMGTPGYLPPEQAQGQRQKIGPASDVYGLGATLYEMLTGEPPYVGTDLLDLLAAMAEPPALPSEHGRPVDPTLEAICLRCLERDPTDRYPSAEALAADLEDYLEGHLSLDVKKPPRRPWIGVGVALGAAVVVAGGALILRGVGRDPDPRPIEARADPEVAPQPETPPGVIDPTVDPEPETTPTATEPELSQRDPVEALYERATQLAEANRQSEALGVLDELLALDPRHFWGRYVRAKTLEAVGRPGEAIADCEVLLELDPGNSQVILMRGLSYLDHGDQALAMADFDTLISAGEQIEVTHYLRGVLLHKQGKLPQAQVDLERARSLIPANDPAQGDIKRELDAVLKAMRKEATERAYAYVPDGIDPRAREEFERGKQLLVEREFLAAEACFSRAVGISEFGAAYLGLGVAFGQRADGAAVALEAFDKAIALEPRLSHAFHNRGVLRLNAGDQDGALADFSEAIRLDPTHLEALLQRFMLRQGRKDFGGALSDARAAKALMVPGDTSQAQMDQAIAILRQLERLNAGKTR